MYAIKRASTLDKNNPSIFEHISTKARAEKRVRELIKETVEDHRMQKTEVRTSHPVTGVIITFSDNSRETISFWFEKI